MIDLKGKIDTNRTIVWDSISYFQQWIHHPDKKSKGNTELKWYIRPEEPYTYVQKVPAKSIRIHILLKGMCNILQDRSYVKQGCKTSLNEFYKTEVILSIRFNCNGIKQKIINKKLENSKICGD